MFSLARTRTYSRCVHTPTCPQSSQVYVDVRTVSTNGNDTGKVATTTGTSEMIGKQSILGRSILEHGTEGADHDEVGK